MFYKIACFTLMYSTLCINSCTAYLEDYKNLLANNKDPTAPLLEGPKGFQTTQIKFKALIADPTAGYFDPQWTKLKAYFGDKPIKPINLLHMQLTGTKWDLEDSSLWIQRCALCRDLFALLKSSGYNQIDIHQVGHFRFDPFEGDKHPGAMTKALEEMYNFRNILLRQSLFERGFVSLSFTFHYISAESLPGNYCHNPSTIIDEWRQWTNGRIIRQGGGAGQQYATLNYNFDYIQNKKDFITKIRLTEKEKVSYDDFNNIGEFLPYTNITAALSSNQLNTLIENAIRCAKQSRLEVLEVTLVKDAAITFKQEKDQENLGILTGKHGICLKINLSADQILGFDNNLEFFNYSQFYHTHRIILSTHLEKTNQMSNDFYSGLRQRYENFNLVYGCEGE